MSTPNIVNIDVQMYKHWCQSSVIWLYACYASEAKLESKMYKQHLIWFPANFDWYVEVSSTIFWLW